MEAYNLAFMLFLIAHVLFPQRSGVVIVKYLSRLRVVDLLGDFNKGGATYAATLSFTVQN